MSRDSSELPRPGVMSTPRATTDLKRPRVNGSPEALRGEAAATQGKSLFTSASVLISVTCHLSKCQNWLIVCQWSISIFPILANWYVGNV